MENALHAPVGYPLPVGGTPCAPNGTRTAVSSALLPSCTSCLQECSAAAARASGAHSGLLPLPLCKRRLVGAQFCAGFKNPAARGGTTATDGRCGAKSKSSEPVERVGNQNQGASNSTGYPRSGPVVEAPLTRAPVPSHRQVDIQLYPLRAPTASTWFAPRAAVPRVYRPYNTDVDSALLRLAKQSRLASQLVSCERGAGRPGPRSLAERLSARCGPRTGPP
jgi:hypothetical protein